MYSHVDQVRPRKDRLKSLKGYQVLPNRIIVAWRSFWKSLELPRSLWTYFHVGSIKHCNEICDWTFFQNVLPLLVQVFSMNNRATRFPHWRNPKLWFTTSLYTVYYKTHTINAKHGCKSPCSLLFIIKFKIHFKYFLTSETNMQTLCIILNVSHLCSGFYMYRETTRLSSALSACVQEAVNTEASATKADYEMSQIKNSKFHSYWGEKYHTTATPRYCLLVSTW